MRKFIAMLLAGMLLFCCAGAAAEETQKAPDFILEGFDGDSSNHVWDTNLFFARMQEKTGISFQFRQYSDYDQWTERKKALLEGEDLPDVLFKAGLTAGEVRDLYGQGRIVDLRPYLEEYAPDLWQLLNSREDWMQAVTLEDGSIPALPNFNELQNNDLMWINSSWLKTLRLEMPSTAEELTEVLRAFKTGDPNRNGKTDEIPLTFLGMWELRFLGHAFGIIDNDFYVACRDGVVSSSLTSEQNRAFLAWLHQLWEEELLDHHGFSTADTLRQITDTNAAIPYGMMLSSTPMTVVPANALSQYSVLLPLSFNGRQEYRDLLGEVVRGTFAVTSACQNPAKLVSWVNVLYTEEGSRLAQAGLEGEDYIWNEDGYWEWMNDTSTVANVTLPEATIAEGGAAPGITTVDFQLRYGESETRNMIEQLNTMKAYTVLPYPFVTLSAEDEKRVAELHAVIAPYAEQTMASFVSGDLALTDESWKAFCDRLEELGLNEAVSIWQKYIH